MSTSNQNYRPLTRGTVIAARYEVEKYLGESLLGPTYIVKNLDEDKLLALKFIRNEYHPVAEADRLKNLMQAARKIKHPNVVRYGNVGEYGDMLFFTQEYFPSINLRQLLLEHQAENKEFSIEESFMIVSKSLDALVAIHEQGLIHTNIKPENILIRQRNNDDGVPIREVKITDLMAAAILGDEMIDPSPYRPPECRPEFAMFSKGPQSDVFSLGNILYELLVGRPAQGTYISPSQFRGDIDSSVDNIIDVALSTDPSNRYASSSDMMTNIDLILDDIKSNAKVEIDHKNLIIAVSLGIAALAIIGFVFLFQGNKALEEDLGAKDEALRLLVKQEAQKTLPSEDEQRELGSKYPEMIFIPAGPAIIGAYPDKELGLNLTAPGEKSAQKVQVEGFYIDRFEYPNRMKESQGVSPVTRITRDMAAQQCEHEGKRLCLAEEWEKACRGPENQVYSYGDAYERDICENLSTQTVYGSGNFNIEVPVTKPLSDLKLDGFSEKIEDVREQADFLQSLWIYDSQGVNRRLDLAFERTSDNQWIAYVLFEVKDIDSSSIQDYVAAQIKQRLKEQQADDGSEKKKMKFNVLEELKANAFKVATLTFQFDGSGQLTSFSESHVANDGLSWTFATGGTAGANFDGVLSYQFGIDSQNKRVAGSLKISSDLDQMQVLQDGYPDYRLGVKKDCKSGYGVYGMSGGPREWTSSDVLGKGKGIVKGGDVSGNPERVYRCAYSTEETPDYLDVKLSFRCCKDMD